MGEVLGRRVLPPQRLEASSRLHCRVQRDDNRRRRPVQSDVLKEPSLSREPLQFGRVDAGRRLQGEESPPALRELGEGLVEAARLAEKKGWL
jgi:hypothetical protein